MNRNHFIKQFTVAVGGVMLAPTILPAQTTPKPAALPAEKVKEFVSVSHSDFGKVKALLEEMPSLLYASWDWGGGDFETGLEASGHVGNKEITNYLIEKGGRLNLFALTMLGKTAMVKSYLELYPNFLNAKGPHGFSLLHHAIKGGDEAKELADYLQQRGLKETKFSI